MDKQERINAIYAGVTLVTNISAEAINSRTRKREIVEARQLVAHFIKQYTTCTLQEIADETGRINHTTILWDLKTVGDMKDIDKVYRRKFEQVHAAIIAEFNHVEKYTNEYNEMAMNDYSRAMLSMANG